VLTPKYQRNPIWSIGQKCFLIDSLIFGCPIPQVYINIKTEGLAKEKKTIYEVVDGQQRLRAILEFLNDDWPLIETTAKSYPVSELYKKHIGKKYSELPDGLQNVIWDCPLPVQELRGKDEKEIQALFRRLNYVVERLSNQELRHSQYFGEFNDAVESLTKEQFWDEVNLFTRRDSQRMKDMDFISELFVIVVEGVQDGQKTLDSFHADYDVVFPQKSKAIARFNQVVAALRPIKDTISSTRFLNKTDFYGLFASVNSLKPSAQKPIDLSLAQGQLAKLSEAMDQPDETLEGTAAEYHTTIIEGANKLAKRTRRMEILRDILLENI